MLDNAGMDWTVMDKMSEILDEFNDYSPLFVATNLTKGEYTRNGKLIEPYKVTLNSNGNLGAVIKYREGKKEYENLGNACFVPERIYKLMVDFLKVGCKDFDIEF